VCSLPKYPDEVGCGLPDVRNLVPERRFAAGNDNQANTHVQETTMSVESLADAFYHELRDMLSAEKQLTAALKKLAENATDPRLQEAFQMHLEETEAQVERIEQAFEETGKAARAKTCKAMKGLLAEGEELLEKEDPSPVRDAMLIACAQKVEHYEIATYGTLCTWAKLLGYDNALQLLKQTIEEEKVTDEKLTELAESINHESVSAA
jgi:ferritin-like metal-binding protein YciE